MFEITWGRAYCLQEAAAVRRSGQQPVVRLYDEKRCPSHPFGIGREEILFETLDVDLDDERRRIHFGLEEITDPDHFNVRLRVVTDRSKSPGIRSRVGDEDKTAGRSHRAVPDGHMVAFRAIQPCSVAVRRVGFDRDDSGSRKLVAQKSRRESDVGTAIDDEWRLAGLDNGSIRALQVVVASGAVEAVLVKRVDLIRDPGVDLVPRMDPEDRPLFLVEEVEPARPVRTQANVPHAG